MGASFFWVCFLKWIHFFVLINCYIWIIRSLAILCKVKISNKYTFQNQWHAFLWESILKWKKRKSFWLANFFWIWYRSIIKLLLMLYVLYKFLYPYTIAIHVFLYDNNNEYTNYSMIMDNHYFFGFFFVYQLLVNILLM